jgi:phosphohistidine phosphatase SixA
MMTRMSACTISRRQIVAVLATTALAPATTSAQPDGFEKALRLGGVVLFMRHASTTPGVGDPPGFTLEQCGTQRNLSPQGRVQAKNIGAWFKRQHLKPSAVKSSAWCRCKDTADLAFGSHQVWRALNSTFNDRVVQPNEIDTLKAALGNIPAGKFEVWVSHGVVAQALTGEQPAMGEVFLLGADGKLFLRRTF